MSYIFNYHIPTKEQEAHIFAIKLIQIDVTGLNLTEAEKLKLSSLDYSIHECKIYDNDKLIIDCTQFFKNEKTGEIYAYNKVTERYIQVEL